MSDIHIYPIGDLKEHITEGFPDEVCWCDPIITEDGLLVHNSLDGREEYERNIQ